MRSDNVTKGVERAPNRSLFYALGYTKEELERPLIGVVCSYNEIVPGRSEILVGEVKLVFTRTSVQTPVNPDSCGLEFAVEDVDAQYRRLKQAGVAGCTEPVTYPWGWRAFGFCDPDGNHIDFVQQLDGGK